MKRKIVGSGALLAIFWVFNVIAAEPSFDCGKASSRVERLICDSDELARQDVELAGLYKTVREKLADDLKKEIRDEQLAWLKKRNELCTQPADEVEKCLLDLYRKRNSELASLLAFDSSDRPERGELRVLRITPNGDDVVAGQQIVFQFDRPVVPIGRMERSAREIPATVTPPLNCEWRWLNTSALACQLREEDKMRQATKYTVTMRPGIATENGAMLSRGIKHVFITARPKVTYARFVNWLTPGTPLIQVTFNQPVTKQSVEKTLTMTARRSASGSPVGVVAYPDNMPRQLPRWLAIMRETEEPGVNDQLTVHEGDEARKVWVVEPSKELPLDETIWFDVKRGLASSEGVEPGIESRTIKSFESYPEFEFIGIRCTPRGERLAVNISLASLLELSEENEKLTRCAPLSPVALVFTSPVLNSTIKHGVQFSPRLDGGRKDYDPWENRQDWTRLNAPHRKGREYQIWLPELLQAYQKYVVAFDHAKLQDEFGRRLKKKVGFNFFTGHREPRLRVNHNYAVLEKGVDSDVPLYVTNLDKVAMTYDLLGDISTGAKFTREIEAQKVEDISYALAMGVGEMLSENGNDTGVLYASLHPQPTPPNWYRDPTTFVQVTPYQIHFKIGHFNSYAWVTRFSDGLPVADADVSLLKGSYEGLAKLEDLGVRAKTDEDGLAELPGLSELDPNLELIWGGYNSSRPGFFAKVEHESDIALLPLSGDFSVHSSGAYPRIQKRGGHTRAWGTTAQGVYKLGDNVQFKIFVRAQSNKKWISPKKEGYELQVFDPQNKPIYEDRHVILNEFGAFNGEFKVPEQGAVGWYQFKLMPAKEAHEKQHRFTWSPMSVLVSDFTPAPYKVKTELNGQLFKANDQVVVSSQATLHSGGPFTGADVRLSAKLAIKSFVTDHPLAKGFTFGSASGELLNKQQSNLLDIRGSLDDLGQYEDAFVMPETGIYFGSITVESAVKDERGKFVASTSRADYAGRDRFVGLKNSRWLYEKGEPANLQTIVVDASGKPVAGIDVSVAINYREYKAAKVKGPGNAYLTNNIMEWVGQSHCSVQSAKAPVDCVFTPDKPGYYQFVATIKDSEGREHKTSLNGWVTGSGSVVWDQSNDATLQIIPEQTQYHIGGTAKYLVKNPFPGAKALVSVERYGVIDRWVETLETSTPVIEVPVKPDYLPGFYLSVVVVSPRIDKPLGKGMVDLGKPSYRMGYVTAKVSDPYKEIGVDIKTDKAVYKPREKVTANITVIPPKNQSDKDYELAVAVVDESVLALNRSGDNYYDPYAGFNKLDSLDIYNYSLISRLIGRQKFEKKGANAGGGGSSYAALRNLFKFVAYWNPSLKPDKNGSTKVEFELPDNLTGWRIFVLAVSKDDLMGMGDTNFKVNRPTEIRPVMPNQVVEGDEFKAGFNIMNRTGSMRKLQVTARVDGPLAEDQKRLHTFKLQIGPYQRNNVWLPIKTKGSGILSFHVEGHDALDGDAVGHQLKVKKRSSLESAATYGTTTAAAISESFLVPEGIYGEVGYVGAVISPSVLGNLDGAFGYIKSYPYQCWEQRLTKAVVANAYVRLKNYLSEETVWPTPGADVESALNVAANYQAPNGGMVYWVPSNQHVSPYLSAYTAMAFNWLKRDGHEIPEQVEDRLHEYLLNLLRRDVFPTFFSKGMSSTVRAVALAALADAGKISIADIERYESHVPEMDLFGKSFFLQAATGTKGVPGSTIAATVDSILGHASQSGGKFQFSEPWDDSYKYILATPLRSNCSILSSLVALQSDADVRKSIADIPFKLVRSITQSRANRDHWENTQENVFCLNALIDYASVYEQTDPDMAVSVMFNGERLGGATFSTKSDNPKTIKRSLKSTDSGLSTKLEIKKEGKGRLYYSARMAYALKEDRASRINSGIEVRREYSVERDGEFVLLNSPMEIKRGDIVKVNLFVSVPTARHFVVVNDPIPGGLESVNRDLATASQVDAEKGAFKKEAEGSWFYNFSDWTYYGRYFWSFYHKELRHDSARFYADYLPAGHYQLSYTAQAIAEGRFAVMPVRVEEMYDPDVYGKGLPASLVVTQ